LVILTTSSEQKLAKNSAHRLEIYQISKPTHNPLIFAFKAKKLLKKYNYDAKLLVAGDPWESFWSSYFLNKFLSENIPIQTQVHGDIADPYWKKINLINRARYYLAKASLSKSTSIRAVSRHQVINLCKRFKIKSSKIYVIPVPIKVISKSFAVNKVTNRPRTIGLVGRIHEDRGVWDFIRLVKVIDSSIKDFKVIVIGAGNQRSNFLARLKSVVSNNRVIYLGQLSERELNNTWNKIGVLVSIAPVESYGRVMREALLAGVSVWATPTSGAKDLFKYCKSGQIRVLELNDDTKTLTRSFESLLKSKIDLKYRNKFIKDNSGYTAELINSWLSTIKKSNLYRS
jgi:glycosyltransferase involved in cell wall biosynthesis